MFLAVFKSNQSLTTLWRAFGHGHGHLNMQTGEALTFLWPTLPPETDDKIFYNYKLQFWETLNMIFSLTIKKNLQSHLVHQLVIKNVPATTFHNQLSFVGMKGSLLICCFRFQHDDSAVGFTRLSHIECDARLQVVFTFTLFFF